jgi:hypothetical protein
MVAQTMAMKTEAVADSIDPPCNRKRRRIDDPFFASGDRIAWSGGHGTVAIFFIEEQHDTESDGLMDDEEDVPAKKPFTKQQPVKRLTNRLRYSCVDPTCKLAFRTIHECNEHYQEHHVFCCRECPQVMPNDRLLDMHLQEVHDSFFAVSLDHGKVHLSCLIEDCPQEFASDDIRHKHLHQTHGYPKWFRFHSRRQSRRQRSPSQDPIHQKKLKWIINHHSHNPIIKKCDETMETDGKTTKKKDPLQKQKRRERQKEKRATIPCRFYSTKEGCWRGDNCMFLHGDSKGPAATDENRMEVDTDLATTLSKVSIAVPEKISFGHKRR